MQAQPITVDDFSTGDVPWRKPLAYWNDLACDTFTGLVVEASDADGFCADMRRAFCGEFLMANPRASESTVLHTSDHSRLDSSGAIFLHLQLAGRSVNRQCGREAPLQPGDFALCSTEDPYALHLDGRTSLLTVRVPGDRFAQQVGDAGDILCRTVNGRAGVGRAVVGFLHALWEEINRGELTSLAPGTLETLVDLVGLACRQGPVGSMRPAAASRQRAVLRYIQDNIRDPELSLSAIARTVGVTPRCIQKVVAQTGQTVSQLILQQRLEGCRQWLCDPRRRHLSITDIALGWGFSDLSYFNRSFKRAYGKTPSDCRDL